MTVVYQDFMDTRSITDRPFLQHPLPAVPLAFLNHDVLNNDERPIYTDGILPDMRYLLRYRASGILPEGLIFRFTARCPVTTL